MSIDQLFEVAQGVLEAHGLKAEFRRTPAVALYRCESLSDRRLEIVVRDNGWALWYVHTPTNRTIRVKGTDADELSRSLAPLCEETAFEPPETVREFPRFS